MTLLAAPPGRSDAMNSRAPQSRVDFRFLLETLVCDLSWSLMQAATLAITTSGCARAQAKCTLWTWRHLLVEEGASMKLALRYGAELGLPGDVAKRIDGFYDAFARERRALKPLAVTPDPYSEAERPALIESAKRFERLTARAGEVLSVIEPFVARRLGSPYTDDLRMLAALLRDANAGGGSRIDARGHIDLPQLSQRRRAPRAQAEIRCRIALGNIAAAATIENVSRDGLGLRTQQSAAIDSRIVVILADGRRLDAQVRRSEAGHLGISLALPLPPDDPLFAAATSRP